VARDQDPHPRREIRSFDGATRHKPLADLNLGNAYPEKPPDQSKRHQLVRMGQESYLRMNQEIMTCGPSPGLAHPAAVNLPDRTNRIFLTAGGVTHRQQFG
jgi:hypothetical protein